MDLKEAKMILELYQLKVSNYDYTVVIPEEYHELWYSKDLESKVSQAIGVVLKELTNKDNTIVKPIE